MKLEYKHLRKYPFYEDKKTTGLMVLFAKDIFLPVTEGNLDYVIQNQLKPILRPLSDLTEKFIDTMGTEKPDRATRAELDYIRTTGDMENTTPKTIHLLEDHLFDIQGLIKKGLAIDYNKKDKVEKLLPHDYNLNQ